MNTAQLQNARHNKRWTQQQAAKKLGVSQTYLSLLEKGLRPFTPALARRAVRVFGLSPACLLVNSKDNDFKNEESYVAALASLGYPGFAYLHSKNQRMSNPAQILLAALSSDDLPARVTEALPWLVLHFPEMDWAWLVRQAKLHDLQNRLGYVVELAHQAAAKKNNPSAGTLAARVAELDRSRLVREDSLCQRSMTQAETAWLRKHRPTSAQHWNLLTDFKLESLRYVR